MKVVHIIVGLVSGGAERTLVALATEDDNNEHHVISLTGMDHYGDILMNKGVQVHAMRFNGFISCLVGFFRLRALLKRIDAPIVQTWMYHANVIGGICARSLGLRLVWNVRTTNPFSANYSRSVQILARLSTVLSSFVPHKIIYCAESAKERHEQRGFDRSKGIVVTNGYNLDTLKSDNNKRAECRTAIGVSDDVLVFGAIGRFNPKKNFEGLIEALADFNDHYQKTWLCLFIGDGLDTDNEALKQRVVQHGLQEYCKMVGLVDDIVPWLSAIDVLVSNSHDEGFPNVVAEAQVCGTPAIVTDAGDSALIVGECGWVIPINTQKGEDVNIPLVNALISASKLHSTIEFNGLLVACRERAEQSLALGVMVDNYRKIWCSISR